MFRHRSERRLATVLFVDVVDSTRIAAEVGDRRWRELVGAFRTIVRRRLREHDGREVDTAGDGFFATFASPARAVRAGAAIAGDVQQVGLDVRCGIHTGELEQIDRRLGGIAAHIGARVAALAGPAEVLVTSTVRDLVVGGDVAFEPAHEAELKGVPGRWALHRVTAVEGRPQQGALATADATERRRTARSTNRRDLRVVAFATASAAVIVAAAGLSFWSAGTAPSPSPSASAAASALPPIAVLRLAPASGGLLDTVRDSRARPGLNHLIVGAGNLWQVEGGSLTRRDLATGEFLASIDLPPVTWQVHAAFGSIWVGHGIPVGVIDRIDPTSGRVLATIEPGEELWDSAAGDRAIYLLTRDSRILEIDPLSNSVVDEFPAGTATDPVYIGYQNGRLYLCECGANRTTVVDPASERVVDVIEGPQLGFGGGTVDPQTGLIWIGDRARSTITPYDPDAGTPGRPIGLAGAPRWVALGFGWIWVAAEEFVYRISSRTHDVQSIEMPDGAYVVSIGIDEETETIWVSSCHGACEDPL